MEKLKGLKGDWLRMPNLAQDLMNDPDNFLKTNDVQLRDYACPKEVHEALARASKLGDAMSSTCADSSAKGLALHDSIKALKKTVETHFGSDFIAETMPFGILFKEKAKLSKVDNEFHLAITGTGSCTFCSDNDSPDVD